MANVNTVSSYTSSTGLSTATVTEYFNESNIHVMDSLKAVCLLTMAAETGFQSTTAKTMSVPLFSVRAETFIPTKYMVELVGVGSFPAGTDKATASLSWQLATAAIPTTLAIGGSASSGFTPVISTTLINAASAAALAQVTSATPFVAASSGGAVTTALSLGPNPVQNTLITAASTVGTSVPATVDQFYQGQIALTSTNKTVVVPGKTLYINITTGGTISTADLTVTGSWRFYIYGNSRVAP